MGTGYEKYWRNHPRKRCPQCNTKTFLFNTLSRRDTSIPQYECYRCGYKEGQPVLSAEDLAKNIIVQWLKNRDEKLLKVLEFELKDGCWCLKPTEFLGPERFANIASALSDLHGKYVSCYGAGSHFSVPVKNPVKYWRH
jgi:Zn ribbon nucleic-acid-binding protein